MKIGIVVFPGSNCDRDVKWALEACLGIKTKFLWHKSTDLTDLDGVVLPGGFSYGDYLRCGSIAAFSPLIRSLKEFVQTGRKVLGICNGFQILTETKLLPGALTRNQNLNFICSNSLLKIETKQTGWFNKYDQDIINLPIAHGEGRFQCDLDTLKRLNDQDLVALRYVDNPNGSMESIAGIVNKAGNVLGLMPHPERSSDKDIGNIDGINILRSLI
tara:strand:+ start:4879 stop:5526 length:648 start_codon:yes stop_codon:yes gene_type:complete